MSELLAGRLEFTEARLGPRCQISLGTQRRRSTRSPRLVHGAELAGPAEATPWHPARAPKLEATLEPLVVEQFCADYESRLFHAKARLLERPAPVRTEYGEDVTAVMTLEE